MKKCVVSSLLFVIVMFGWSHKTLRAEAESPEGELRIALAFLGSQRMIPWQEIASGVKHYQLLVYDYLVGRTSDGQLSTETGLAYKWEEAADKLSWTFYLRKGVKFHNGDELTAEDVKFSIDQFVNPKNLGPGLGPVRSAFKEAVVKDPYQVVIHLKNPSIFLPWIFSGTAMLEGMVLPKKYFQQVGPDGFAAKPIGSGPYRVAMNKMSAFIQLEAVPDHWRGQTQWKQITLNVVPEESTRVAMLKTGEADIIASSRERVADLDTEGFNIFFKKNDQVVAVYMQQQWDDVPIADARVRQALNLAINKEEIIKYVFAGQGVPAAMYPLGSFGVAGGADATLKPYPYDLEKAKTLLAEAGYPNGFETTIYSYVTSDLPELPRMVEAVADYLSRIGVKAKIVSVERSSVRLQRKARTLPGHLLPWSTPNRALTVHLLTIVNALHHSKRTFTSTASPKLDDMIDRAMATTKVDEAQQLIGDIHRHLYEHSNNLTIAELHTPYVSNKKITAWDLGRNLYDNNFRDLSNPS